MSIACGYDEEFVDTPADYLKCVLCCLVLKDPVQIMRCGHRYCTSCFQQMKKYSQHLNSLFICPIDRDEIDPAHIFNDTGMNRIIADLKVKCSFHREGCGWSGELRSLDHHKDRCHGNIKPASLSTPSSGSEDIALQLREMNKRMDKCEEALYEKEKEIGYMKLVLQQTRVKMDEGDEEVKLLKQKNGEMEKEIFHLQEWNKTLQGELNAACLHCDSHHRECKHRLLQLNDKVGNCVKQADADDKSIKSNVERLNRQIKISNDTMHTTTVSIKSVESDLKILQEKVQNMENDHRSNDGDKSFNILKSQMRGLQSNIDKFIKGDTKQQLVKEIYKEVYIRRTQQLYVETIPNDIAPAIQDIRFIWRVDGFKERFDARKRFRSEKFLCFPHGHVCQLFCDFRSEEDDMDIYIRLCKEKYQVDTHLFRPSVTFQLVYNNGRNKPYTLSPEEIDDARLECFTFKDPQAEYTVGRGFSHFFTKREMDDYVKGNACTVICTLTPI